MTQMIRRTINTLTPFNPFSPVDPIGPRTETDQVIEAVVLDVIVHEKHPEYSPDGYNVGAIKFRVLKSQMYRTEDRLNWAFPLNTNQTEYPMKNEIVHIIPSLNRTYYTHKINTSNRVTTHPVVGLEGELVTPESGADRSQGFRSSVANPKVVGPQGDGNKIGDYFEEKEKVYRLRHDEGDVIFEGRSGHSIRFGAAWVNEPRSTFKSATIDQAPNLLMRVGAWPDAPRTVATRYGLVKEDINEDKSSIWMCADQIIPLKYSTEKHPVHKASIDVFPARLDGNQIVINTDRFVVNTKTDKIFGFSKKGIHWTTEIDFSVDAGRDYVSRIDRDARVEIRRDMNYSIWRNTTFVTRDGYFDSTAKTRHSFISPKVYIGMRNDESEPVPAGTSLAAFLQAFIDAHLVNAANHVITPVGPGALSSSVVQALTRLRADVARGALSSFNSRVGYVKK